MGTGVVDLGGSSEGSFFLRSHPNIYMKFAQHFCKSTYSDIFNIIAVINYETFHINCHDCVLQITGNYFNYI